MHGRALSKSFLVYKRIMDGNLANHCSARSKGNLRPCQIVDIEFELLDVEMTLSLWQRFWLKEPARRHLCVNTFCRRIGCQIIAKAPVQIAETAYTGFSINPAEVRNGSNIARSESVCTGCTQTECPTVPRCSACHTRLDTS